MPSPVARQRPPLLIAFFAGTVFLSAFLLFQVQPLIAKAILPWFGGAASIWVTCMLFFQTVLLAGYAYAHLLTERVRPKWQGVVHLGLAAGAVASFPLLPRASWQPEASGAGTLDVLSLLAAHVGVPVFWLAATAPLAQVWWRGGGRATSPYRWYAVSNAGSLLALVTYPVLFEPLMPLRLQAGTWRASFLVLVALVVLSGSSFWWAPGRPSEPAPAGRPGRKSSGVSPLRRLAWVALAATGSVVFLATTNQISHDLAAVPLMWVVTLGLYLLSFVLCFSGRGYRRIVFVVLVFLSTSYLVYLRVFGLAWLGNLIVRATGLQAVVGSAVLAASGIGAMLAVTLLALFSCCMVCHGELWRLKPAPERLTSFYLHVALGGAVGGVLMGVGAPLLLDGYYEMPLGWLASWFLILGAFYLDPRSALHRGRCRPVWAILGLANVLFLAGLAVSLRRDSAEDLTRFRNFYGVLAVEEMHDEETGHQLRRMIHGTIVHGLQYLEEERRTLPTTYYSRESGIGIVLRKTKERVRRRIGVVGLGAGTLAAYGRQGDTIRFYEIDPAVVGLANSYFTFLKDSSAEVEVVEGDGRLSLERELARAGPHRYDVLVVDAFTGGAIPVHLLTREAVGIYLQHLVDEPGRQGILALHVTNRFLDLVPLARALAEHHGLDAVEVEVEGSSSEHSVSDSHWILLGRRGGLLQSLEDDPSVEPLGHEPSVPVWTDDFTNILRLLDH